MTRPSLAAALALALMAPALAVTRRSGPEVVEVHLEELGEHSWLEALLNTINGSFGSAQYRFVARPPGGRHEVGDHVAASGTFPAMRLQGMDDVHGLGAWAEQARERLADLDGELRCRGWQRDGGDFTHWWSRTYRRPDR